MSDLPSTCGSPLKRRLPQAIAENDLVFPPGWSSPAGRCGHEGRVAQEGKEILRDVQSGDVLGRIDAGKIGLQYSAAAIASKERLWSRQSTIVRRRDGGAAVMQQSDQAVGVAIVERVEEDGIHHAEDRGIGADAEREREDGEESEARRPQQGARTIAKILGEILQATPAPGIAR